MDTISSNHPTRVVLQGELGYTGKGDQACPLKTAAPTSCHVVTMYDSKNKIGFLAHIDDYTSVTQTINKIALFVRKHFDEHVVSERFQWTATMFGGNDDQFSIQRGKSIQQKFEALLIPLQEAKIPVSKRLQISIDPSNGKVTFWEGQNQNPGLEYLQRREYYEFNRYLDQHFKQNEDPPYYEPSIANRLEKDLPELSGHDPEWRLAGLLEDLKKISLDIRCERTPVPDKNKAKNAIDALLNKEFADASDLITSFKKENYDLLLRQAGTKEKYINLFSLLLEHGSALGLDFTSRGKTAGSVWNVAKARHNQAALKALDEYVQKQVGKVP